MPQEVRLAIVSALAVNDAMTFGDFSALADHVSRFGPVRGLPGPADDQDGLANTMFTYMAQGTQSVGGVLGDVAANACESTPGPWASVETDVTAFEHALASTGNLPEVPASFLSPLNRAPVQRGPYDPAGVYSFDNPHFLDMVLNDRNHFAGRAHSASASFAQFVLRDKLANGSVVIFSFGQLATNTRYQFSATVGPPLGDVLGDIPVGDRIQIAKRQVFQLPLDLPDTQAGRQGGEDIQGLLGNALALVIGHMTQRAHVVQAVRQLD